MDRNVDELIVDALLLDMPSQRRLADAIENNLSHSSQEPGFREAKRRNEAVERGEMKLVDGPEALARVRALVGR
jgi:hypothetical protein